ncbi:hypothetical protein SAMN05192574_102293 [Mucilaginibacter gossypiicola]|uniref:Uncharacterized protein n=1 Tax=Mucilaginibacter gossypiicola TaxID=551995 RepID=A0A1H8DC46_9SPHI|nr:hypothetical protein [Mucilaginibacter gossypiicola]SEN04842.1 hypothetical protein SAMN05192574_102293 [Mucilaginibacter gossypiicola]
MKSSRVLFFALALVLGMGNTLVSKAAKPVKSSFAAVWWDYNGTQTPAQLNDPANYSFSSTEPVCSAGSSRCAIEADRSTGNPNQPNLATIVLEKVKP